MWMNGEQLTGHSVCHRPTWDEILPVVDKTDPTSLGAYRIDDGIAGAAGAEPMRDLYAVLWCFERI